MMITGVTEIYLWCDWKYL